MSGTHTAEQEAVDAAIDRNLRGRDSWTPWPGGWCGQIELCLVDAVFSANAKYGKPASDGRRATGVHAVLASLRTVRGDGLLDDLAGLVAALDTGANVLVSGQLSPGTKVLKTDSVRRVARVLLDSHHVATSADLAAALERNPALRGGLSPRVPGVGAVTWEYFLMLAGHQGIKADRMVLRFVNEALVSRKLDAVDSKGASRILKAIADSRGEKQVELDHAIWAYQRDQRVG